MEAKLLSADVKKTVKTPLISGMQMMCIDIIIQSARHHLAIIGLVSVFFLMDPFGNALNSALVLKGDPVIQSEA